MSKDIAEVPAKKRASNAGTNIFMVSVVKGKQCDRIPGN